MSHLWKLRKDDKGNPYYEVFMHGRELLEEPFLNKGTAFPEDERHAFGLCGLLPPHVATFEDQKERAYENFQRADTPLLKHIQMRAIQDRNETLFYATLMDHEEEMVPILYTPTVGEACRQFSHLYRTPRGLFVTARNLDHIDVQLRALADYTDIDAIVATDSEGILGIGDQGVGGMPIPIGKLTLYVLGAGFHPARTLPVTIDIGTDNQTLLNDPLYLGARHRRLRGDDYFRVIDGFVAAIQKAFPKALLQWEDFSKQTSFDVLNRYRDRVLSFNDDIQGTSAVVLGGLQVALGSVGRRLKDEVIVFLGAGAAGMGVAHLIAMQMVKEGLPRNEVRNHIYMMDSKGLIFEDRPGLEPYKLPLAQPASTREEWHKPVGSAPILGQEVLRRVRATILIGVSGRPGEIREDMVKTMCLNVDHPVIFPLSNPTSLCEAKPEDLIRWSDGKALVATGSPFPPVEHNGKKRIIGQGNNVFIFPGLALGAVACQAKKVTDEMLLAAANALVPCVTQDRIAQGAFYPPIQNLRAVSLKVAEAVAREACRSGLAQAPTPPNIEAAIAERMWVPQYLPLKPGLSPKP